MEGRAALATATLSHFRAQDGYKRTSLTVRLWASFKGRICSVSKALVLDPRISPLGPPDMLILLLVWLCLMKTLDLCDRHMW